jgi:hypothetical protein
MAITKVTFSMIEDAYFNIRDYGAVSGTTTNQSSSIQAAINACAAAGGGVVYIPVGVFYITTALSIPFGVSIKGEGGNVSVISAYSCNVLNFNSASYDGGQMFYEDFGMQGAPGGAQNYAAVQSILPAGGTLGVDSRDGLYFNRLHIQDFTIGFVLEATWESHIEHCKIRRVNAPIRLGDYTIGIKILSNNMIFEGGSNNGSGISANYGVHLNGVGCEGNNILNNQIYGFSRGLNAIFCVYLNFNYNDVNASAYGAYIQTANNLFNCFGNYFEVSGNNAVGVYFAPLNSEISSENVIHANNFISTGGTGTIGIKVGDTGTQYAWHNDIQFNLFNSFASYDILIDEGGGKTNISNNRCVSSSPTYSIRINPVYGPPITVSNNWCYATILINNAADLTDGKILLNQNTENNTYQAWRRTAAPTTGTWRLGDIVYNSDPASTEYVGWVCTVAGTPGTWKGFGTIA